MAMTASQVIDARRQMVNAAFPGGAAITVTKPQIDAAMAAATTWLEANAASFVTSLNGTVLQGQPAALLAQALAIAAQCRYGGTS